MDPELKVKMAEFIGAWAVEVMEAGAHVSRIFFNKEEDTLYLGARIEGAGNVCGFDYALTMIELRHSVLEAAWLGTQQGEKTGRELTAKR